MLGMLNAFLDSVDKRYEESMREWWLIIIFSKLKLLLNSIICDFEFVQTFWDEYIYAGRFCIACWTCIISWIRYLWLTYN